MLKVTGRWSEKLHLFVAIIPIKVYYIICGQINSNEVKYAGISGN